MVILHTTRAVMAEEEHLTIAQHDYFQSLSTQQKTLIISQVLKSKK